MVAIDTNLLVYAHRSGMPEHRDAQRALERAAADVRGWGIPLPCIAEFWNVVTHPQAAGGPADPKDARAFLEELTMASGARVWLSGERFWQRLTQHARNLNVRGPRIFDLQIALTALDNGAAELWTHDSSFVTLPNLSTYDPL